MKKRTLMVGVDYSDASLSALDQVLQVAQALGRCRIVAVLVLPGGPTLSPPRAALSSEQLVGSAVETLRELILSRLQSVDEFPELQLDVRVQFGDPATNLLEIAEDVCPFALAVGTHGRHGVERLVLGSVAETLVREAACSVWVVRSPFEAVEAKHELELTVDEQGAEPSALPLAAGEPTNDPLDTVLSSPHLDGGRVVVHMLDRPSGRRFRCSYQALNQVAVEPVERRWVAASTGVERARIAQEAIAFGRLHRSHFERLFEELARRQSRALAPNPSASAKD